MKPSELERIPVKIEKLFYEMQNRVMEDIVRRILKTGNITSTADYQIEKLISFGNSSEFIESEIQRLAQLSYAELWELYDDVIEKQYTRNRSIYELINSNFIPYEDNEVMQSWVEVVIKQTSGELTNITRSMGFSINMGGKKVFTPFSEYYQKYLDRACMEIVTGVFDYNTVLRRVSKELSASGIRTITYDTGYVSRATVASRRAIMTGVNQLMGRINEMMARDLGTDMYEVTWHSGHRPEHWWGGLVFSYTDLEDVCGLGDVAGLCGANCYHNYIPFVEGASVRTYTDDEIERLEKEEEEVRIWNGKEYNAYTAKKRQRVYETTMRSQRSNIRLLQAGKADANIIMQEKAKYVNTLHQYQGFSKKMKLEPDLARVYVDGLGRVG